MVNVTWIQKGKRILMDIKEAWGDTYVSWKGFISIVISMIVVGASLFGYVLNMHAKQPHSHAASIQDYMKLEARLDRLDERHQVRWQRIEDKIDKLLDKITP